MEEQNRQLSVLKLQVYLQGSMDRFNKPRDTKICWFVNICSSLANIVVLGSLLAYPILFPKILDEFQEGKAKTALVVSIGLSLHSVGALLSARLCIRFGSRVIMVSGGLLCGLGLLGSSFAPSLYVLYISYGIVVGFATSMVYNAGYQIIPLYFEKHCFAASSFASMGFGAGYLVMCPIAQVLLDHFGWRKALLVMAAINVVPTILGCSITRKPSKRDAKDTPQGTNQPPSGQKKCCTCLRMLNLSVFKDPTFVILTLSAIILVMGHYMVKIHLAKYAEDLGISGQLASRLYVIAGGTSLVARLLVGKVCDFGWIPVLRIFQCGALILGIATCLLPLGDSFAHLIIYSIFMGIAEGMYVITIYTLMNNKYPGVGFGWFLCCILLPYLSGPPLSGFLADVSGSYDLPFYTAGGILILSACIIELTRCTKRKKRYTINAKEEAEHNDTNKTQNCSQNSDKSEWKELHFTEVS